MASQLGKREVAAPIDDWLSDTEVCELLQISRKTLLRMIDLCEFPRAVPFRGESQSRWRWVDVAWYLLGREISDRLGAGGELPPEDNDTPPRDKRTPPVAK